MSERPIEKWGLMMNMLELDVHNVHNVHRGLALFMNPVNIVNVVYVKRRVA